MNSKQVHDLFRDVANEIADTLVRKNIDYGDSFHKMFEEFGDVSTYIRLSDKLGRLKNLVKQMEMRVVDESIEDAYKDIAGYCILTLVSRMRLDDEKTSVPGNDNTLAERTGTYINCGKCSSKLLILEETSHIICKQCGQGHTISQVNGHLFVNPSAK